MPNTTWKSLERRVAEVLGGKRNPLSGGQGKHTRGDIIHPDLYVEVKLRKHWAVYDLFMDTRTKAAKEGKTPLAVIHEGSRKHTLAVVDLEWLVKLLKAEKS